MLDTKWNSCSGSKPTRKKMRQERQRKTNGSKSNLPMLGNKGRNTEIGINGSNDGVIGSNTALRKRGEDDIVHQGVTVCSTKKQSSPAERTRRRVRSGLKSKQCPTDDGWRSTRTRSKHGRWSGGALVDGSTRLCRGTSANRENRGAAQATLVYKQAGRQTMDRNGVRAQEQSW
jgi:hypothetical protein